VRPTPLLRRLSALVALAAVWTALPAAAEETTADRDRKAVWLPSEPGTRWTYVYARERERVIGEATERETLRGTLVDEVVGPAEVAGRSAVELRSVLRGRAVGAAADILERRRLFVAPHPDGLRLLAREQPDAGTGEPRRVRFQPPLEVLRTGTEAGEPWPAGVERSGGLETRIRGELVGVQDARTPAGLFEKCLVVRHTGSVTGELQMLGEAIDVEEGSLTSTSWYAPGVGLVLAKEESEQVLLTSDGQRIEIRESVQYTLSSHRHPARSAPAAASD